MPGGDGNQSNWYLHNLDRCNNSEGIGIVSQESNSDDENREADEEEETEEDEVEGVEEDVNNKEDDDDKEDKEEEEEQDRNEDIEEEEKEGRENEKIWSQSANISNLFYFLSSCLTTFEHYSSCSLFKVYRDEKKQCTMRVVFDLILVL